MQAAMRAWQSAIKAGTSAEVIPVVGMGGSERMMTLPLCQRFSRMPRT